MKKLVKIKKALISLSDKSDLKKILDNLYKYKIEIISSGGTYKEIKKLGFSCKKISDYTGFPEVFGGRVKSLHPLIYSGILSNDDKTHSNKVDVILHGIETIGSAERSSDKEAMRHTFNTISNGEYANMLFANFTKERVQNEMNKFLSKEFFPRFGGGIGMTRIIRAMKLSNLI